MESFLDYNYSSNNPATHKLWTQLTIRQFLWFFEVPDTPWRRFNLNRHVLKLPMYFIL
jgi:hypothetical protein